MRRTRQPRKSSVNFEVAVVFIDKHVRDLVASNGKNLSDYKNEEGWPTARLRLEYPSSLGKVFRDLDWYGREMQVKHGPGTRRNIKFNDAEETMYIDVCLPSESYWHRIPHSEASQYREKVMSERARVSRISLERGPTQRTATEVTRSVTDANRIPLGQSRRTPSMADSNGRPGVVRPSMGWMGAEDMSAR